MFKNYFKTIYRNFKREKLFTFLNLSGLGLGLGCVLVIFKIISYELKYDKHQSNYDDIYRVVRENIISSGTRYNQGVPHPIGKALQLDYPELNVTMTYYEPGHQLAVKREDGEYDRFSDDVGLAFAQSSLFSIFEFDFIAGNPATCLDLPQSVVLSRSRAIRYFGLTDQTVSDAMGQEILFENDKTLKVTALIEDYIETTDVPFNVLVQYEMLADVNRYYSTDNWGSNSSSTNCYFLAPDGFDPVAFEDNLVDFTDKYHGEGASVNKKYHLQPLSDIHFNPRYNNYPERIIASEQITSLAVIGLFLLLTAAINFINLTTAQSIKRAKEIGIRKTLGGKSTQLAMQFFVETLMITFVSSIIGLVFAEILLIQLEDVLGYKLLLDLVNEPMTVLFLMGNVVLVGLLAGIYPAVSMSRMDPIVALKKTFNQSEGSSFLSFRRILVIAQFVITQILIIGTIVVAYQMDFFMNKDLGFDKDNIVLTYMPNQDQNNIDRLKNNLLAHPEVENVSFTMSAPLGTSNSNSNISHHSISEDEEMHVNFKFGDESYIKLYDLKVIAGQPYGKNDTTRVMVNRKLATALGYPKPEDVVGQKIGGWYDGMTVVGVLENFHTHSLKNEYAYCIFMNNADFFYEIAIKLHTKGKSLDDMSKSVKLVQKEWEAVYPKDIFESQFLDEQIVGRYDQQKKASRMFQLFAVIAIFIGCLGLYGLIAYVANKKTKEIGVRKVLGASTLNIVNIFGRELIQLIGISFLISAPIAYFVMNSWLENFAYKIDLSWGIFLVAFAISFGIAILTAGYRAVLASLANPVLSLQDE